MPRLSALGGAVALPFRQHTRGRSIQRRARGALLGLAVGDALGTALEFQHPVTFEPIADLVGGKPWWWLGKWTHNTLMALCLAESLIGRGELDPGDQIHVCWYRSGHLNSAGHCSITRLAPVPIFYFGHKDYRAAVERAGELSRMAHGAEVCVDACRYLATLIVGALNGVPKAELLSPARHDFLTPEIRAVAEGSIQRRKPPELQETGDVVESLQAALWAFYHGADFREGCLLALTLGDDAKTTGIIYGQLAGAFYGVQGIPAEWREWIAMRDLIFAYADRLLGLIPAREPWGTLRSPNGGGPPCSSEGR